MKKHLFLYSSIFLLLFLISKAYGQKQTTQYEKVTFDEVAITSYEADTTASAIVLYRNGVTTYNYNDNKFRITTTYTLKIKILKTEGLRYADISIPYYSPSNPLDPKENITSIEACAYNLENEKIDKTPMKKEFVSKERLNDKYMVAKFSIPAVKVGTVIEYKYIFSSPFYYHVDSWEMQYELPVLYSQYEITIPNIFIFNIEKRGANLIETSEKEAALNFTIQNGSGASLVKENITCKANRITFISKNLPALKEDDRFTWCADDYKVQIGFELEGSQFPGSPYKSYTSTWESIDEELLKENGFGKSLSFLNPFREEMKLMKLSTLSPNEKIARIFGLLKQKVAWNGKYALYSADLEEVVRKGSGSNADLNFIFISMLRETNLPAYPTVMSLRTSGILPVSYPSLQKLNTFVVCIQQTDSSQVFLDGSMNNTYLNTLPVIFLVEKARIITKKEQEKWVNLTLLSKSTIRTQITATLNNNGTVTGKRLSGYTGQEAAQYRSNYTSAKDSSDFIAQLEASTACKITSYQQSRANEFSPDTKENITFIKQSGNTSGDLIYINPMIFADINKNPFTQADRLLPVEFPYTYSHTSVINLTLPEGYRVEELPAIKTIYTNDKAIVCKYNVQTQDNQIIVNYLFSLNRAIFLTDEYKQLQTLWETAVAKNNEMIVLKKIEK